MDYGLAGQTVIVTGAARGQGAAEAEILVREGQEGDRYYVIGMGVAEALKEGQFVRTLTVGTS